MNRQRSAGGVGLWVTVLAMAVAAYASPAEPPGEPLNIILVITDDQRWDTLRPGDDVMPLTRDRLARRGVVFANAVISSPLCCPSRSSILSGGFAVQHHGVWTNRPPNGGAPAFPDARTVATLLRERGYVTALIGKYMNSYRSLDGTAADGSPIRARRYVPPGWSAFVPFGADGIDWYDYPLTVGTAGNGAPTEGLLLPDDLDVRDSRLLLLEKAGLPAPVAAYYRAIDMTKLPHVSVHERDLALRVIAAAEATHPRRPFLLVLGTAEPHAPATPTPADRGLFAGFTHGGPALAEDDLGDKPAHIIAEAAERAPVAGTRQPFRKGDRRTPDEFFADQLRSLRSVDRTVAALVDHVEASDALRDRTVFIFMSDHGVLWGEHGLLGLKQLPYEESIRVPLIVRMPGIAPRVAQQLVAADLDVGATILHLAGFSEKWLHDDFHTDGRSLVPLLRDPGTDGRDTILIQDFRQRARNSSPSWAAVRGPRWKYVTYDTGEEELYDLRNDPHELRSLHADPGPEARDVRDRFAGIIAQERGLVFLSTGWERLGLPAAVSGRGYAFRLTAGGGTPPYTFFDSTETFDRADDDCGSRLPGGLALEPDGRLHGTPTESGCFEIGVTVRDTSVSPVHGGPQQFARRVRLRVTEP